MVWAGLTATTIIGPHFFEGRVTGAVYCDMLENVAIPQMLAKGMDLGVTWFQQDGAPVHIVQRVSCNLRFT